MMRRSLRITSLVLLSALTLLVGAAVPAFAQDGDAGNETDTGDGGDVNVDVDPDGDDGTNGGGGEEEATGGWIASPTGILVILVLALVIVGLIVAVAAKR